MDKQGTDYSSKRSQVEADAANSSADLSAKITELMAEKKQTKKELQLGFYCSQCKRSKSQIERETKQSFAAHLKQVKGVAQSMPITEIMRQMRAYDDKIERLRSALRKKDELRDNC